MWLDEVGVETTEVLWDENVPFQVEKIINKTITRPATTYGSER